MRFLIICVNYNSFDSFNEYLESINAAYLNTKEKMELTVVIGDNSDYECEIKANYGFSVQHFFSHKNLGYFGGIEYAITKSGIKLEEFDYIIISNVDVRVSDTFFNDLYEFKSDECIGCIAPSIYSEREKKDRNPQKLSRPNRNKLKFQRMFYKYNFLDRLYVKIFYSRRREKLQNSPEGYIYAAHGSFMIFTRKFANFLATMKYPCFLFGEEIYIAEHIKKNSLKTYYNPKIKIYDLDHISTSKMKRSQYYKYNYLSIDFILKEFY